MQVLHWQVETLLLCHWEAQLNKHLTSDYSFSYTRNRHTYLLGFFFNSEEFIHIGVHVECIRELNSLLVSDYSFSYTHYMHMYVYKFLRTSKKS